MSTDGGEATLGTGRRYSLLRDRNIRFGLYSGTRTRSFLQGGACFFGVGTFSGGFGHSRRNGCDGLSFTCLGSVSAVSFGLEVLVLHVANSVRRTLHVQFGGLVSQIRRSKCRMVTSCRGSRDLCCTGRSGPFIPRGSCGGSICARKVVSGCLSRGPM